MSTFNNAWPTVREHEGGFVNNPNDPGGATNWGISLRWLRTIGDLDGDGWADGDIDRDGDVDEEDIREMTDDQAAALYREHWWDKYGYGQIHHQQIATKVFDLAVNMGAVQAHKLAQRAARACGKMLADDGVLGPNTLGALNLLPSEVYLSALRSEAAGFYRGLVMRNAALRRRGHGVPDFSVFLTGWLKRAYY